MVQERKNKINIVVKTTYTNLWLLMAVGGVFCSSNSSMNVENNENLNEFVIIIPRLDENGNQVQDENGNQVTKSDEESNQVKGEKELGHPKLTKQQEDIRNFCSIPRTAQEIMDRLGITNQSKNRQRHIQQLLDMGILEMTNPENPTANNQKYRRAPKK